ncbi:FAS1 domain-containing protein [Pleurostoma richardsiae]|uniref:FAS1 domain-containing protein n=1 Tax=Pleurostoma richardsiae TaxID=41990 RepID=A0AA38VZD4_9PEZI|nr:FAS1 domain-containing protein [Pleurostoma richardsiae]
MAPVALCQQGGDLIGAIANYTELSTFSQVLQANPSLNTAFPTDGEGITLLIPDNAAFEKLFNQTNQSVQAFNADLFLPVLRYHIMAAKLTSKNFTTPRGLTVPTLLTGDEYNNRSAGADLVNDYGSQAAEGQVLAVSKDPINPAKLRLRQSSAEGASLRGGLGLTASVSAVDGQWSLGYFQIIDVVLTLPGTCSSTVKTLKTSLSSLNSALNRTGLWPTVNHSKNLTCLAPNNDAFSDAGNPEQTLNSTDLTNAILFHTLHEVTYTNYLTDGQVLESASGESVQVQINGDDIYFNDAKVIGPNVLTNNGLIHVLDKVMSPLNASSTGSTTTTASGTSTATSSSTASTAATQSSSAAALTHGPVAAPGLVTLFLAMFMLL